MPESSPARKVRWPESVERWSTRGGESAEVAARGGRRRQAVRPAEAEASRRKKVEAGGGCCPGFYPRHRFNKRGRRMVPNEVTIALAA
jgi:hypothetical protein